MKPSRQLALACSAVLLGSTFSAIAAAQLQPAPASAPIDLKFDFSAGPAKSGYTRVALGAVYSEQTGYGFEPGAQLTNGDHNATTTSEHPFLFSAKVPEGNFNVTVTFGDSTTATNTTVKAEAGRLMLERVETPAGQILQRTFTVNVRTPKLLPLPLNAPGREEVTLDRFDQANVLDWDDKLTLQIISPHAALRSIEITSAPTATTVFLAGDSTVTDRDSGPDVSWGQLLSRFFKPGVAVANNAQSAETLKSFANALRLDEVLGQMKPGDYFFLQFGHNDSKKDWPQTYVAPDSTYKAYLKVYIAETRLRGAIPVLVTSMDRGNRTTGAPTHSLGDYPQAMRELAAEEHVLLIDLNKLSDEFYEAAGPDAPKILADGTHSTAYGGYEFAKCIVTGIRQNKLGLAADIVDDFKDFDPSHPDSLDTLNLAVLFNNDGGGIRLQGVAAPSAATQPSSSNQDHHTGNPGPGPL